MANPNGSSVVDCVQEVVTTLHEAAQMVGTFKKPKKLFKSKDSDLDEQLQAALEESSRRIQQHYNVCVEDCGAAFQHFDNTANSEFRKIEREAIEISGVLRYASKGVPDPTMLKNRVSDVERQAISAMDAYSRRIFKAVLQSMQALNASGGSRPDTMTASINDPQPVPPAFQPAPLFHRPSVASTNQAKSEIIEHYQDVFPPHSPVDEAPTPDRPRADSMTLPPEMQPSYLTPYNSMLSSPTGDGQNLRATFERLQLARPPNATFQRESSSTGPSTRASSGPRSSVGSTSTDNDHVVKPSPKPPQKPPPLPPPVPVPDSSTRTTSLRPATNPTPPAGPPAVTRTASSYSSSTASTKESALSPARTVVDRKLPSSSTVEFSSFGRGIVARPCKANDYWGFCKGAWDIREGVKNSIEVQSRPIGFHGGFEYFVQCGARGCQYRGRQMERTHKKIAVDERVIRHRGSGIRYRWMFLAKSHKKCPTWNPDSNQIFACIFCCSEGSPSAAYGGVDSLLCHIWYKHCETIACSPDMQRRYGAIIGREADPGESFDINIPIFYQDAIEGRADEEAAMKALDVFEMDAQRDIAELDSRSISRMTTV